MLKIGDNLPDFSLNEIYLNKNIDGVVIATSAHTHKDIALEAIKNNKDVLIEKPFCLSVNDAEIISKNAVKKNRILIEGHLLNYHNVFKEMKKNINDGKIGSIKNIRAQRLAHGFKSMSFHDITMIFL